MKVKVTFKDSNAIYEAMTEATKDFRGDPREAIALKEQVFTDLNLIFGGSCAMTVEVDTEKKTVQFLSRK